MAPQRANNKSAASAAAAAGAVRAAKIQKQRKKHKVVLESAGNKDEDTLRVVLSFDANPPPGFTFIPAGNTQLTAAMKTFAKRGGHKIMAVSATPHAQRHELSREVHRIGYHFPTEVVDQVCSHYGIRLDKSGRIIGEHENDKLFMKISQKGEVVLNENVRDQVTINTEAKEIIRDLFPKIPDNDLFQIIKTAFQLGDRKVGTAEEIPLVRRAQLSVVAHIRHSYTNYDKLLRQVPYNEARHMVEKTTLRKLVEWRGDENDKTDASRKAVDDAVREVVVLSDEEESESELEEGQVLEKDDSKVEPMPQPARPEVTTQYRPVSPGDLSSGEDAPNGYRYVPQTSRRNVRLHAEPDVVSRRQQSRYAVWDQVRQEYHTGVQTQDAPRVIARIPLDEPSTARHILGSRDVIYEPMSSVRYVLEEPQPIRIVRQPSPPRVFRGADGRLYERLAPHTNDMHATSSRVYSPSTKVVPPYEHGRRSASPRSHRPQYHRRSPNMNDDGLVLPSVEQPDAAYQSPSLRQHRFEHDPRPDRDRRRRGYDHPRDLIDLTSSAEQATERMRLSPSPPPSNLRMYNHAVRDIDMVDSKEIRHPRHLIELDHQLPTPSSSLRGENAARSEARLRDEHAPLLGQHLSKHPNSGHEQFAQSRIVYEPIDDQQSYNRPIRYVTEQQMPAYDHSQTQRYYMPHDEFRRRNEGLVHIGSIPADRGLNEGAALMNVTHQSMDPRHQPFYRTTYVQH